MKRKLLSFAIAFAMLSQTVIAATGDLRTLVSTTAHYMAFADISDGIFNYTNLSYNYGSKTKTAGDKVVSKVDSFVKTAGEVTYFDDDSHSETSNSFDYMVQIDMSPVSDAFDTLYTFAQNSISAADPTNADALKNAFKSSTVKSSSDFKVIVKYSDGIVVPSTLPALTLKIKSGSSFVTDTSGVYTLGTPTNNTVAKQIEVPITINTTISDLKANPGYLSDLAVEVTGLTISADSTLTASMVGTTYIREAGDSADYAKIEYVSDDTYAGRIANIYYTATDSPSISPSGGSDTSSPTAEADSGDEPVDVKVTKIGSNYYVNEEDLPDEDADGNPIFGWYLDEDCTIPVSSDKNGRIKISGNTTFHARKTPLANTVVDDATDPVDVQSNDNGTYIVDMTTLPEQDSTGHTIYGWDLDEKHTVPAKADANGKLIITKDTYLYARTQPIAATVVDGSTDSIPVLSSDDDTFTINVDEIEDPAKDGFAFTGWYTEPNFINPVSGVVTISKDTYLYPRYKNLTPPEQMISEEHILYVYGYPDGEVKPNNYITREEVAAIFCRLLKPEYRATIESDENAFPDVESGRWSNHDISTMAKGGYIVGDENGYFNPSNPITRAEFTVIASKFAGVDTVPAENNFTDIDGHWAKDYILKAASQYWITGYEDLTFRPQNRITRAEAMTIVNTMLVRYGDHDSEYAKQWPDLKKTDWYYDHVIEATSHNYYTRNEDGWSETWIYADDDNNSHAR